MHHERLVELVEVERSAQGSLTWTIEPIEKAASILCVDCTEKMTGRSCHIVRHAHGKAAPIELVELRVGIPGLVKVDAWDRLRQVRSTTSIDVVAKTVVGGVGDHGVA